MDDLRDLFESDELKTAVAAIEALQRKRLGTLTSDAEHSVRALAFERTFQAREVLRVLAGDHAGFPGQKKILAAGFAAWLLFPKRNEIRQSWMTHAMLDHLDEAELQVGFAEEPWSLPRDIVARYVLTGSYFLGEVYGEFGGYQAFSRSTASEVLDETLHGEVKVIRTIIRAMCYLHHGSDLHRSAPEKWHKPSINRALNVFKNIRKNELEGRKHLPTDTLATPRSYLSRSLFLEKWSERRGTLSLLYAASRLKFKKGNLLEILLNGSFSYEIHGSLIGPWVQMAQYVSDHIFTLLDDFAVKNHKRLSTFSRNIIGDSEKLKFSAQPVHRAEISYFEDSFKIKKTKD